MEFLLGGFSSCCAVLFTNPFDVLKTRQQLEGELLARQNIGKRVYKGFRQSIVSVIRTDGLRGLQKGLPAAVLYQFSMNSVRLGTYQTVDNLGWTRSENALLSPLLPVFWGAFAGVASATISCPVYVVKTQQQAVSSGSYTAKFQHRHTGMMSALVNMYREGGFRGLYRGYTANLARVSMGSSTQMASFAACKDFFTRYEMFRESVVLTAMASSTVAGLFTSVLMSPCDVVTTRMTNQGVSSSGKGLLYNNIFDCFVKIYRSEGAHGFYKGFVPLYARVAPHTMLNLTFWEFFKSLHKRYSVESL
ncbi:solute carrier family 25 member 35-like [Toxorhynchites rutilus septentrionalis]|uniref:solute carrier family 25 member 35-like n=1 Tax=Toxorhynchites rutilus septentrionalis TaxID=329112 RepID=UPI00247A17E8|nr:solute carrier family 25 member 35-like [Toxorhynchites rutilus septentrionalis]